MTLLPPPTGVHDDAAIQFVPTLPSLATGPKAVDSPHTAANAIAAALHPEAPFGPTGSVPIVRTETETRRGFLVAANMRQLRSTLVFGGPMVLAYALVAAAMFELASIAFRAHDLISGGSAAVTELDSMDRSLERLFPMLLVGVVLGSVLTSLWAGRVARNGLAVGIPMNVAPARWAWFVPIWIYFGGFRELRRSPGAAGVVGLWQILFIGQSVASVAVQFAMRGSRDVTATNESAAASLSVGRWVLLGAGVSLTIVLLAASAAVIVIARNSHEIERTRRELIAPPSTSV